MVTIHEYVQALMVSMHNALSWRFYQVCYFKESIQGLVKATIQRLLQMANNMTVYRYIDYTVL